MSYTPPHGAHAEPERLGSARQSRVTPPQYVVTWHKTTAGQAYGLPLGHPDEALPVLVAEVHEPRRKRVCRFLRAAGGLDPVAVAGTVEQAQAIEGLAIEMAVEAGEWASE